MEIGEDPSDGSFRCRTIQRATQQVRRYHSNHWHFVGGVDGRRCIYRGTSDVAPVISLYRLRLVLSPSLVFVVRFTVSFPLVLTTAHSMMRSSGQIGCLCAPLPLQAAMSCWLLGTGLIYLMLQVLITLPVCFLFVSLLCLLFQRSFLPVGRFP